jgi:L-lactate dehydrogenase complex protein LldG
MTTRRLRWRAVNVSLPTSFKNFVFVRPAGVVPMVEAPRSTPQAGRDGEPAGPPAPPAPERTPQEHVEDGLDEALDESFPASDPPSQTQP